MTFISLFRASIIATDSVVDSSISEIKMSVCSIRRDYKDLDDELIRYHNEDQSLFNDR